MIPPRLAGHRLISANQKGSMNRLLLTVALPVAFGIVAFQAQGQTPPAAQPAKPSADPYANNADAGKLKFPLAAPAGKDSGAMKVAPPGAVNAAAIDPATWKLSVLNRGDCSK